MATLGERLATLEQIAREAGRRLNSLEDDLHGGGDVERKDSIRGRLHTLEATVGAMVLRRNYGIGFVRGWVQLAIVLAAVATAAAAWYAVLVN